MCQCADYLQADYLYSASLKFQRSLFKTGSVADDRIPKHNPLNQHVHSHTNLVVVAVPLQVFSSLGGTHLICGIAQVQY